MDNLSELIYRASNKVGGCDVLARKVGAQSWEIFQWMAGVNLPTGRTRDVLEQALRLITLRIAN